MLSLKKKSAVLALAAGLTLSLAACGSDDSGDDTASSESSTQEVSKEPVADIDSLTGKQTAVTLDPAFVEGITGLGLTPAAVGDATIESGVAAFPITGGEVTYFDPERDEPDLSRVADVELTLYSIDEQRDRRAHV